MRSRCAVIAAHCAAKRQEDAYDDAVPLNASQLFGVHGKVALVTGGSKGIGFMIAKGLVANGAKVYVLARKAELCERAAAELCAMGPGTHHS